MFKPTKTKRIIFFLIADIILLTLSFYLSYTLRFDFKISKNFQYQVYYWLPFVVLSKIILLSYFRLYTITWRFVSLTEFFSIIKAFTIVLISMIIVDHFALIYCPSIFIPRSVPFIDYFISIFLISLLRISKRAINELILSSFKSGKRTLIIGAGSSGERLVRALKSEKSDYSPVAFIDDDKNKVHTYIHGVRVEGTLDELDHLIKEKRIDAIIIAIPDLPYYRLRKVIDISKNNGIEDIKIIPGMFEDRDIKISDLREINLENLLSRDVVKIDVKSVKNYFENNVILVTGAGGSIGSEICRQLLKFNPKMVIAYELDETELHNLIIEINNEKLIPIIGDIRDLKKFSEILKEYKPQIVFHSAAYKHVPLIEMYPEEAVKTNIIATYKIANLCIEFGVKKFINISTDKAVNPVNIMGMTKRVSEIICSSLNQLNGTKFISVRFGNVLGSRGSVVPIFINQIKKGGPVTVTHPEVERYFMTIPEAVLLVLQASIFGDGGEVYILDMGEPVKIVDLAKNLIRLHGLEPEKDIKIVYTGLRPGEKLKEELLNSRENQKPTSHEKIFKANIVVKVEIEILKEFIDELEKNIFSREVLIKQVKAFVNKFN